MSWTEDDIAPATDSWSEKDVVPAALPKAVAQPQYVSNEAGHLIRLGKTIARMPFELGRSMHNLVGTPTRENPIPSQGEGYDIASDAALTALPGAAAARVATTLPVLGKALAGPGILRTAGRAALGGGAGGATAAALTGHDVPDAAAVGALGGPVLAGMGNLGAKVVRGGKALFEGAADRASGELRQVFGNRLPQAIQALQDLAPTVSGERLSAGMAASPSLPEFKVLEEGARSRPGADKFLQMDADNQAARLDSIEKYAAPGRKGVAPAIGAPVPPSALEQERYRETDPLYEAAFKDRIPISKSMKQALTGAEVLPLNFKGAMAFDQQRANIMAQGGSVPGGATVSRKTISIQQAQAVKDQISKEISSLERATDSAGIARKQRLIEARGNLTDEMKKGSPRYAAANDLYAKMMIPDNQSAVAQQLVSALRSPTGAERAPAFLSAMQNAPQTIQRAGIPRFKQLEQIVSPEQLRAFKGVQGSLEREAGYNALQTKPGIVPEYLSPQDKLARMTPRLFDQVLTTARSAVQYLGKRSDKEVQSVLSEALTDPQKMSALLNHVSPSQRSGFVKLLDFVGNDPAAVGAAAGSLSMENK